MSASRILRSAQVFLLVSLLHLPLPAQEPQSHQRGLTADTAYQLGEIDTVNLFNGNVVITLPIGMTWPVGTLGQMARSILAIALLVRRLQRMYA